jgi:hypothetical protein
MSFTIQYLEYIGKNTARLKNADLFTDHPFYRIDFEPGELKKIVDDAFNDTSMIPHSIAVRFAEKYRDVLKITEKELSDEEYISHIIKELIGNFDMGLIKSEVEKVLYPEKVEAVKKVDEIMNAKPGKSNAYKKCRKRSRSKT